MFYVTCFIFSLPCAGVLYSDGSTTGMFCGTGWAMFVPDAPVLKE